MGFLTENNNLFFFLNKLETSVNVTVMQNESCQKQSLQSLRINKSV